jgi:hypothetical protein
MMKVYDRVYWQFLLDILTKIGFVDHWCKWIMAYISGAWFSIIINGVPGVFFQSSQGIRKGDPLSPSLFIILEEVLSRHI